MTGCERAREKRVRVSETRARLERLNQGAKNDGPCPQQWGTVKAEITAEKGSKPSE